MKKMLRAVILVVVLCLPSLASADVVSRKFVLDNGLTVIVNEMPSTPVAAVYAWVKTGSANEGKYLGSGITHFVEHMIFKGTARRGPGVVPDEAKSLGGSINASTSHDFTVFTLNLPKENFVKGVDLIADMVRNAAFDPKEVEREREVILKEMKMINDRPDRRLGDLVFANVYNIHPYRLPIIGRELLFKAITRNDLVDYYRTYYAPNNMIVSVSGPFTADEALAVVKEKFADAKPFTTPLRALPSEPEQISPRSYEEPYATDLYRVSLAYQGIPLFHRDIYALDVLAMALGDGESSRLYRRLFREKKLVESIDASDYTPVDRGFFEINFLMALDRREKVLREIRDIIADVQKNGLKADELAKVKRQVEVENIRSRETAGGMAYKTAVDEAFAGDYLFSDKYLEGVREVTNDDIKRVAREYLIDRRMTVISLIPSAAEPPAKPAAVTQTGEIEKYVLANGLTVLLKEDRTLPTVAIDLAMAGGIRQEPDDLGGLAALTGRVWDKSLKGQGAEQLSLEIESRGGSVGSGTGKNTVTLGMFFLKDDLPFALEKLEQFVKAPAFDPEIIGRERELMLTAIAARKDSIMQTASKELIETLFQQHPFRRDGLGTEETLKRIGRKDVLAFFERFVSSRNMVISIFGDIDKASVLKDLERRFGNLPTKPVELKTFDEPAPGAQRFKELTMDKQQAAVLYGFRAPVISSDDSYATEVAVNILSSSLGGRMFKRIRDELGKAYTLGGVYQPGVDAGMTVFFVLTTNENIDRVRAIMDEEFGKLSKELVSEKELADAKIYLKSDHARTLETVPAQASVVTIDEILGLGHERYRVYDQKIDAVTAPGIQAVAAKYFVLPRSAVVVVRGQKDAPKNGE